MLLYNIVFRKKKEEIYIINFTHREILDFMNCPLKYKFKHINKVETKEKSARETFSETLHKTIQYFYNVIKDEQKIPSNAELRDYWGDLWLNDLDTEKILYNTTNEKSRLTRKGYSYLQTFYQNHKYNPGIPIGVNVDYAINLGNYSISGNIELIRVKDGKVQLVYFSTSQYKPSEFQILNDISYTLTSYAYRQMFKEKENELICYHLATGKEIILYRNHKDVEKVLTTIDNIYNTIKDNRYWQRMSYLCSQCPYQDYCTNWTGKE